LPTCRLLCLRPESSVGLLKILAYFSGNLPSFKSLATSARHAVMRLEVAVETAASARSSPIHHRASTRAISPSSGCLLSEKPGAFALFRGFWHWERRCHWPMGAATARFHRCSKTSTRPPATRRFRGRPGAACASTTSANEHFHEHDYGPLEHPKPPNPWLGRLLGWIESFLSIEDNRRRYARSGVEKTESRHSPP